MLQRCGWDGEAGLLKPCALLAHFLLGLTASASIWAAHCPKMDCAFDFCRIAGQYPNIVCSFLVGFYF